MKLHLLPIAVLSAIALSACSGSDSNSNHPTTEQNPPPNKTEDQANQKTTTSGKNIVIIQKDNDEPERLSGKLATGEWSAITLNGEKVLLNIDGNAQYSESGAISFQYFPQLGHKAIYHLTDGNQNFRYGHIYSSQDPNDFDYFAAGTLSPESVMKGSAVYKGNAFLQGNEQKVLAKFKADVNFEQKTVTGAFSNLRPYMFQPGPPAKLDSFKEVISAQDFAGQPELGFSATIKGNQFEGNGAVGNFYGDKAQSIGGVIKQEKYTGAFGGSR